MKKEIYLAGGCFWGVEKYFQCVEGVVDTTVGYANGNTENPTYQDVCYKNTGHAETVKIVYQNAVVTLPFLLSLFYDSIDPLAVNRQGNDIGPQYRTGIYFTDPMDEAVIQASIQKLQQEYQQPIAIEVKALKQFDPAEEYHQDYLKKNPDGYCHIHTWQFQNAAKARQYQPLSKQKLKDSLTKIQYEVTQNNATEPPYQNPYFDHFEPGIYVDITSGQPLFISTDKFESGCGWPSFSKPIRADVIQEKTDASYGMTRTEVRSKAGGAHLGHVFPDGPKESGGLRYCINSAALRFIPQSKMLDEGYGDLLCLLDE